MRITLIIALLAVLTGCAFGQTPAAIEASLISYLDNTAKYGSYGGAYDGDKLATNGKLIKDTVVKMGTRADILRYPFQKLKEHMDVVTSKDGRFRVYSWDLEDGGTMHDYDHVIQYIGKSGKVFLWEAPESDGGGGFYTDVFQVETATTPIYLAVSTSRGSTRLNAQTIEAMTIDGDKLVDKANVIKTGSGLTNSVGFGYDFFTVVDRPERPVKLVTWNAATKSFRFPVVIEDNKNPDGRVTNKFITYKFNGKYFVKVS